MTDEAKLQANGDLVIKTLSPISDVSPFGYNRESVAWVEGYIERHRLRTDTTPEAVERLLDVLGSFLGECIIRCHGGRWQLDENGWAIRFDGSHAAYPLNKVRKQFDNGVDGGDGILSLFDSIEPLLRHFRADKQRPWWKFW